MTLYAPSTQGISAPEHDSGLLMAALGTDLLGDKFLDVDIWVNGHTYHTTDMIIGHTRVISNP